MASSVLHYIISKKVAEQMQVKDIDSFLMGAVIAPDTGTRADGSYDKRHFFEKCSDIGQKGINWLNYLEQNADRMNEDYYLGYYCHLIEDSVWYHDFFDKYIRIYPQEIREIKFPAVYRDYWRLNYILKKELKVEYVPFEKRSIPDEFIETDRIESQVKNVNKQFGAPECSKEDLEMIPWDFIMEYIDKCEKLCKTELSALKGDGQHIDPKTFFAAIKE